MKHVSASRQPPTPLPLSEPIDTHHALASVLCRLAELELRKALHAAGRQPIRGFVAEMATEAAAVVTVEKPVESEEEDGEAERHEDEEQGG